MLDNQTTFKGFFQKHHQNVRNSVDDITLKNFSNLEDDKLRICFVRNIPQVKDFDPKSVISQSVVYEKDIEKSRVLKNDGNKEVQNGNWKKALDFYTNSYLHMPEGNDSELSIIIANRSATLYHLQHYEQSLADIDFALSLGYAKDLKHKILERKARCLLALKWNREAILAFRETVTALDDAKLPKDKCSKKQTDAQLMIEILEKSFKLIDEKNKHLIIEKPKHGSHRMVLPPLFGKNNKKYPNATNCLTIESSEQEGRFAKAVKNIPAGEVVVTEKAHCSVLLYEYSKTHCQNCFQRCFSPIACPTCANVIFCSKSCKEDGMAYHKYECPILNILCDSGCSITCHMALRIISQRSVAYFAEIQSELNAGKDSEKYNSDDYRCVYNLVTHKDSRSKVDYFQRTHMAVFLLNLLKSTAYFDDFKDDFETESYIGELILRNLQILQFNAHEIFELQTAANTRKDLGKSIFLGGGLYPTLALFNHSCEPGVIRYFKGTSVVVRAIKNVYAGQQLSENYGPIFTQKSRSERRSQMKDQYWFDCNCIACEQNWPKFDEMQEGFMRFKCDANSDCKNVIPVSIDCQEFLIKCGLCQQFTNILKGLKALQDTELCHKIGKDYMEKGEYRKAIMKYLEEIKLYDETLAPPFKDYHLCQENIRRCFLTFGNFSIE